MRDCVDAVLGAAYGAKRRFRVSDLIPRTYLKIATTVDPI